MDKLLDETNDIFHKLLAGLNKNFRTSMLRIKELETKNKEYKERLNLYQTKDIDKDCEEKINLCENKKKDYEEKITIYDILVRFSKQIDKLQTKNKDYEEKINLYEKILTENRESIKIDDMNLWKILINY